MKINAEIGFFKLIFVVAMLGVVQGFTLVAGLKLWDVIWKYFS